jgi:uncharacterized damage-inducible protein DinB
MNRVKWIDKKFDFHLNQKEFESLLSKLNETPDRISRLVINVPEEFLIRKVGHKWSIKENIGHLVDLEELHGGRIDDFSEGKENLRPADLNNIKTNEANHNEKDINSLLNDFKSVRERFVKRLSEFDETVLNKNLLHPRLNQSMRPIDMAQFVLEHDKHHIETIKEILKRQ